VQCADELFRIDAILEGFATVDENDGNLFLRDAPAGPPAL
jgi:hypothetical protein